MFFGWFGLLDEQIHTTRFANASECCFDGRIGYSRGDQYRILELFMSRERKTI
jgi:hypothetical protein